MSKKRNIYLIGGGPACITAALFLSERYNVTLYEKGKSIGRKFLVAGKGGFNLTNSLSGDLLQQQYSPHPALQKSLKEFGSEEVRNWLEEISITTFVGSSGRVFPTKGIKPIAVLNAMIAVLERNKVTLKMNHEFVGFSANNRPIIRHSAGKEEIKEGIVVFGLGGGSWKKTGSNSDWLSYFTEINIKTRPFESSNAGINITWPTEFIEKYGGIPLKNISLSVGEITTKGEALITEYGLEGNAVYPIAGTIREALKNGTDTSLYIDFKPANSVEQLKNKISTIKPKNYGYALNLNKVTIQLIKNTVDKETYLNPNLFVNHIKRTALKINSLRPIEETISTVGGICTDETDTNFRLRKYTDFFVIGEMLDWDAPTGGFLLQGCFSSGYTAAHFILNNY